MKTLVIGAGNPSFRDDGAGLKVIQILRNKLAGLKSITFLETSSAGLDLLNFIGDYKKAIIVDAVITPTGEAGNVHRLTIADIISKESSFPHQIDYAGALHIAKETGLPIPEEIIFYGIEVKDINEIGEGYSPEVERAIDLCVEKIIQELNEKREEKSSVKQVDTCSG